MTYSCLIRVPTKYHMAEWVQNIGRAMSIDRTEFPLMFPAFTRVPKNAAKVESSHWFNLLLSKYFNEMRENPTFLNKVSAKLQQRFDKIKKPSYVGPIHIDRVDIGDELLKIKHIAMCRRREKLLDNNTTASELVGEAKVNYRGGASIKVSFNVYINWPRPKFATLPVSATIRLENIAGIMRFFAPATIPARVSMAFSSMPETEFGVRLVVGGNTRHLNLTTLFPRVRAWLTATLRKLIWKSIVSPNKMCFSLPLPGNKLKPKTVKATSRRSTSRRDEERVIEWRQILNDHKS
eukprot:CAMPEP_0201549198 /NCGR_PEP_ID=MMETSP0173_2-20130828/5693_1 /ASSEMBLY_ACC=CAM_ASM_000268 /TAXON_ID=218659 /ORGANISM="Vexillifera sp., Strain DIVA3 564/2" /LENGTH=292 /DNA_ID=CAMNT_0047958795 /DNA_START=260 /DNA_END=1138 /DNA_ORIENTATION=+